MKLTCREDGVKLPLRSELKRKHEQIKELRDRAMSNVSLAVQSLTDILTIQGGDSAPD
jgi:hypothetical protein